MSLCRSRGVGQYRVSEVHALITSRTYKPDGTRRGIIFCHAYGQSGDSNVYPVPQDRLAALALAGYPVLSCDLSAPAYAGSNWGNDDLLGAIDAALAFLTGTGGAKTDGVGLLGASMGALNALVWARQHLSTVFAMAGAIPVLDLNDIYQTNAGGLRPSIQTAYGVTHPAAIPSIGIRSPVAFGATDLAGLPVKLWTSANDPIAATTAEATSWDGRGATTTVVDLGRVGHVGSSVRAADVVQWFDDNGGRT